MQNNTQNINHALVAKAHTSMYLMHKFWARKPHNVVSEYIKHYSKEGDVVLDPFSGSGVTVIEAIKSGRKAAGIDLNPVSIFITRNTAAPYNLKKLKDAFLKIEKNVKDEINGLYETGCEVCGEKGLILASIWNKGNKIPEELRYFCGACNKKLIKSPGEEDVKKICLIEGINISYWHPTKKLKYNHHEFKEGTHDPDIDSVDKLFTKRNLLALSIIYNQIENLNNKKIKEIMKFAFTSMVHLASRMCPVAKPSERGHWSALSATSFWAVHRYWIPPRSMESNVWMLFESAVNGKQGVIKGKTEANDLIKEFKEAKEFGDLKDGANILIREQNALELTDIIPKDSVDYIFTDPPYGGAVQYFELSTLWASWLKKDINYNEEITVNKQQEKDFEFYHKMLKSAFREMYLVLKPGKYLTVTFHSTDIKTWNSIIKAVVMSGFDLEKIIYQPPARASAKGLLQPYGSAVGDYYIRFRKPEPFSGKLDAEKQMDMESYEREVVWAGKGIIETRGEPTMYQHILNGIMVELKGGRYVPVGAKNIEDILKEHLGEEFELIEIKNEKGVVIGKKWWLKGRDFSNFTTRALADRVEGAVVTVLDKKVKASFDDILQSIFIDFPNALTPDMQDIKKILGEYAKKTPDGKWMLKAGLSEKERVSRHTKMIYILATLGKKAGFDIWIGSREQGEIYDKKPLKVLCDDIRCFKNVPQEEIALGRVKQIDVMWLENHQIKYEFEVENTTGISEAIIRGSNIPESQYIKRFIIIPEERENFLFKKLQEPVLKETIKKIKWDFIRFHDIESVFKNTKTKKTFDPVELNRVARMPRFKNDIQKNLLDY